MTCLMPRVGVQDPSAAPSISWGEFLSTKTIFQVDILQFTRTVCQRQKYGSQKVRLVHLDFPRAMDFDGLGLCLPLAGGAVYVLGCMS